jgi:hypothetical protein
MRISIILSFAFFALLTGQQVFAQNQSVAAPWVFEIKGGEFKPDLELYEEFYGSDTTTYLAATVAYRPSDWWEIGGELGYMHDSGVGILAGNQTLGGSVRYKLVPVNLYVSAFGKFVPDQWVVPYAGVGVTTAWYKQSIDAQPNRSGRTDLGYNAKAGLQLLLNGIDKNTAQRAAQGGLINTYLFIEGQYFSTKVDGIDLGGLTYLLGLRLEFGFTN